MSQTITFTVGRSADYVRGLAMQHGCNAPVDVDVVVPIAQLSTVARDALLTFSGHHGQYPRTVSEVFIRRADTKIVAVRFFLDADPPTPDQVADAFTSWVAEQRLGGVEILAHGEKERLESLAELERQTKFQQAMMQGMLSAATGPLTQTAPPPPPFSPTPARNYNESLKAFKARFAKPW